MITFLWAQTEDGVIGQGQKLPWKIKEEMKHFTNYTKNKTVLMGRNTWDSLYIKPLPNRKNIVITSRPMDQDYPDVEVTPNLEAAAQKYKKSEEELVVIGGKKIFDSLMKEADRLVISIVKKDYIGDTYAPVWNQEDFLLTNEEDHLEFHIYTYERK